MTKRSTILAVDEGDLCVRRGGEGVEGGGGREMGSRGRGGGGPMLLFRTLLFPVFVFRMPFSGAFGVEWGRSWVLGGYGTVVRPGIWKNKNSGGWENGGRLMRCLRMERTPPTGPIVGGVTLDRVSNGAARSAVFSVGDRWRKRKSRPGVNRPTRMDGIKAAGLRLL